MPRRRLITRLVGGHARIVAMSDLAVAAEASSHSV